MSEILSGAAFEYLVLDYADAAHKCAQHWASAEDDALKAHLGSRLRAHDAALRAENERLREALRGAEAHHDEQARLWADNESDGEADLNAQYHSERRDVFKAVLVEVGK